MRRLLAIASLGLLVSGCGESISQPQAMLKETLSCPEGSSAEIERWGPVGENGWLQACKMKHGTFTAWHGEHKVVEGEYVNGREQGTWRYWSDNGALTKEIAYDNGKPISTSSEPTSAAHN